MWRIAGLFFLAIAVSMVLQAEENQPPAKEEKPQKEEKTGVEAKDKLEKAPAEKIGVELREFQLTHRMFKKENDYFKGELGGRFLKFCQSTERSANRKARPSADPLEVIKYKAEEQSAYVFIPSAYDGSAGWGLYLHIGNNAVAAMPAGWDKVCADRKLLFASPHKAADLMPDIYRIALALDTLATLQAEQKIDKNRIYIGGSRTGAACAIIAALVYPDLFRGVLCHKYGFLLQRTPYGPSALGRITGGGRESGEKIEQDYAWDPEAPYVQPADYKKILKTRFFFSISGRHARLEYDLERMFRSIPWWDRLGVTYCVLDRADSLLPELSADDFSLAIDWLDGKEIADLPPPRYALFDIALPPKKDEKAKKR